MGEVYTLVTPKTLEINNFFMDKFNKQYSPEELEEMKQDFASPRNSQNGDREKQRKFLLERLRQQQTRWTQEHPEIGYNKY